MHLLEHPFFFRHQNQRIIQVSGNVSQTCRFVGVSRALYYIWKERYEKHGIVGVRDLPRRPHKIRFRIPPEIVSLILRIRKERRYGAVRVSLYLQRHYHAYVSPTAILKIFHRHHVGPVSQKKYRPGPKPPDAPLQVPGRSVQLDVKFVPVWEERVSAFINITAIDEATRFRVLRIYDHDNTKTTINFLREVQEHFPFMRAFEDVGVSAYGGAAPLITSKQILATAARIALTEALHSGHFRLLVAENNVETTPVDNLDILPPPSGKQYFEVDQQALSIVGTTSQVLAIVYGNNAPGTSSGGFFPNGVNDTMNTV